MRWLTFLVVATACSRTPAPSGPVARLSGPERVDFGQLEVGARRTLEVQLSNMGEGAADLTATVEPPFVVDPTHVVLGPRSVASVQLSVAPLREGAQETVLRVGDLSVRASVDATRPVLADELKACRAECDAGSCPTNEGALCAPSRCDATTAHVCRTGQCREVPRAAANRCVDRWLSDLPSDVPGTVATDERRGCLVRFDALGETWEWDDRRWRQRFPPTSPPSRSDALMTWDPEHQQVLLYGGRRTKYWLADLWAWDGTNWISQRAPQPPPFPARRFSWDATRREAVLVTGPTPRSVWRWNGTRWAHALEGAPDLDEAAPPAPKPRTLSLLAAQRRRGHALVWDPFHERGVLFGGEADERFGDTWHWDGTTWALQSPGTSPQPRSGHALAWDAVRRRVVLFGGEADTTPLNDTWEWNAAPTERGELAGRACGTEADGLTWTRADPLESPPPRAHHALAWDAARQRVVLFGGAAAGRLLDDTWTWNGSTWKQQQPRVMPPARDGHALAWHPSTQRVVLHGGHGHKGTLGDTWTWDGSAWTPMTTLAEPCDRPSLAWDQGRLRLVLACGKTLWALVDQRWERVREDGPPNIDLFWDATSRQLVGFDGRTTWRLVNDESTQLNSAPAPR